MSMEIENKIRKVLKENLDLSLNASRIKYDENLTNLGMDSIATIKVIVAIEKEFNIEFADEDLIERNFNSIKALVEYVKDKISFSLSV